MSREPILLHTYIFSIEHSTPIYGDLSQGQLLTRYMLEQVWYGVVSELWVKVKADQIAHCLNWLKWETLPDWSLFEEKEKRNCTRSFANQGCSTGKMSSVSPKSIPFNTDTSDLPVGCWKIWKISRHIDTIIKKSIFTKMHYLSMPINRHWLSGLA